MSKAFTKEDQDLEDDFEEPSAPVGPGGRNYMTPTGVKLFQDELRELKTKTRPELTNVIAWAAGNGDRSENGDYIYGKKKLREIDRRIRFLSKRLESVEIVDPLKIESDQILVGATVTIRDEDDNEKTYAIVGVDEVDAAAGRISWLSPVGAALLKARVGDWVRYQSPKGPREIEIIEIRYIQIY